ncbi:MAG: TIGR02186 family protein [Paracoccus sp. (in: a-proteobacteria)]|uniref:TIGR02186 family protein n=1 Tax=Paracoccus sp. TaxID=267 RepID=UPI0026E0CFAC|nr:TIGR02186 family protein [Paracoccus sp. (in: a-proteobacteria)]MDO5613346.1 TIGR02186 family protein [Paracoccus sp. (in: a-proteobacteria)]
MRALVLAALLFALPAAAAVAQQSDDVYPTYRDFGRPDTETGNPPPQEEVVAGLSSDAVAITASFDGSDILIYGAVKRETPIPSGPPLQVIVTVEGPGQVLTIRRKARRFGIWINTESLHVGAVPSFYVVATSAPLSQILRPDYDTRYRISVPLAMRAFAGPVEVEDAVAFTESLVRQRQQDGIYRLDEGDVHIAEQTLFRADVRLPANLIEGEYRTRIFLLRDGRIIDVYRAPIEVRKVGLERWLYRMAFDQPLLYGLMSLAVAVIAGWGASAAFRLARRN